MGDPVRTLVIDTATQACSLALFDGPDLRAHSHLVVGRGHAERLIPAIEAFPDGGRAERILVDCGPGSFTGVRIGLAAARALGFAWQAHVSGYSALSLIALMAGEDAESSGEIAVTTTGGHGEIFWQRFSADLQPLTPLTSTPLALLAQSLSDTHLYGSGAPALVEARGSGTAHDLLPNAARALSLPEPLRSLLPDPLYGRGADAKPMAC